MTDIDVEHYFTRLSQIASLPDWVVQVADEKCTISSACLPKGKSISRCVIECALPLHEVHDLLRLECMAAAEQEILDMELQQQFAPGDAIARLCFRVPGDSTNVRLMLSSDRNTNTARGKSWDPMEPQRIDPDPTPSKDREDDKKQSSAPPDVFFTVRGVVWRDFPRAGEVSQVFIKCNPDGTANGRSADDYTMAVASAIDDHRTLVTRFQPHPWPEYPSWAAPRMRTLINTELFFFDTARLLRPYYIVLAVKSCPRGPPLLPVFGDLHAGPQRWIPAMTDNFNLAAYLNMFMAAIGRNATFVDIWDGLKVVPYQAVIKTTEWMAAKTTFDFYFKLQQAMYRQKNGGKGAPKVVEVQPRFTTERIDANKRRNATGFGSVYVREHNTFIDVREDGMLRRDPETAEYV